LLITSLATSSWIEATLSDPDNSFAPNAINYGLFVGHVEGSRGLIPVEMELTSKALSSLSNHITEVNILIAAIVNYCCTTCFPVMHMQEPSWKRSDALCYSVMPLFGQRVPHVLPDGG
jgi:hypothetical protein